MAKKSKEQAKAPKKLIQDKIITHLLQEFQQLETLVGKKEFAKRLKKSAKLITQGLQFEEATKEDLAAETKPAVETPKKTAAPKSAAKPAVKKAAKKSAAPKAAAKTAPKKRTFKKA
ncbi:hypothetical protein ACLOAU_16770 [Niabella sp. CJ426]|uniref:hypothetical protein n=1 Tax=Niabella sp. CJ426 TaxID=3393740 RepID=UPI003D03D629